MDRTGRAAALCLAAVLVVSAAWPSRGAGTVGAESASGAISLDVPPGWQQVTPASPAVLLALKGPAQSSFVLTRAAAVDVSNAPALRSFLSDLLAAFNQRTGINFISVGDVQESVFSNGLTARYLRAAAVGKPQLVLAVMEWDGRTLVGTLLSKVPDLMLPSILGSLKSSAAPSQAPAAAGNSSLDGQLAFNPPAGAKPRALSSDEAKEGVVFFAEDEDSQVTVMKAGDAEQTPIDQEAAVVSQTVLAFHGAIPDSLSALESLKTQAGPSLVYASARVSGGGEFAAGYLPWCYWGYSVTASGPHAVRLLRGLFSTLSAGAASVPKLVSSTPSVPLPLLNLPARAQKNLEAGGLLAAALALAALVLFLKAQKRKSSVVPRR